MEKGKETEMPTDWVKALVVTFLGLTRKSPADGRGLQAESRKLQAECSD
jgi:hypothetical protein